MQSGVCSTCGTSAGEPGYLRCDVGPNEDNFGKRVPCPDCCEIAITNRVKSQMDGALKQKTFNNFVIIDDGAAALKLAREFVSRPVGWLTLYGEHGPGKTHLCAAIANEIGVARARYFNAPDLANNFFGQANDVVDELHRHPVIILDELDKVLLANFPWCGLGA